MVRFISNVRTCSGQYNSFGLERSEVQVLFNSLIILEILILKFEYGFSKFKSHTIIATWGTWLNEAQFTPPIHDLFQIN